MIKKSKYYKNIALGLVFGISTLSLTACGSKDKQNTEQTAAQQTTDVKRVKYLVAKNQNYPIYINYKGYIAADEVRKLSFELGGTIKNLNVDKGQFVKEGTVVAQLDTDKLNIQADNARQNILLAQNSIKQIESGINKAKSGIEAEKLNLKSAELGIDAEELKLKKIQESYDTGIKTIKLSYDNAKENYDNISALYKTGGASKKNYDDTKYAFETVEKQLKLKEQDRDNDIALEKKSIDVMKNKVETQKVAIKTMEDDLNTAYTKLDAARLQEKQANIALELSNKNISDSTLKASMDGYVLSKTSKEGEVVGAGTPVVVLKSGKSVINIGVSVEDFKKLKNGMEAILTHDNATFKGKITTISLYPDDATGTYNIEITPENMDLPAGTIVDVKIPIQTGQGIFVPMSAVINMDDINYVYCVEQQGGVKRAIRKQVSLSDTQGSDILVKNLKPGAIVIVDGVKNLKNNDVVVTE